MNVSPPIYAHPSDQSGEPSKTGTAKSVKHDRLGVFAKLLEGLGRNAKQGPGEAVMTEAGLFAGITQEGAEAQLKTALKGGKKAVPIVPEAKSSKKTGAGEGARDASGGVSGEMPLSVSGLVVHTEAKIPLEPVRSTGSLSRAVNAPEKNRAIPLHGGGTKTNVAFSRGEDAPAVNTGLKGGMKTPAYTTEEETAKALLKAEDQNRTGRKNTEKEGPRKVTGAMPRKTDSETGTALVSSVSGQGRQTPGDEKTSLTNARLSDAKAKDKRRERLGLEVRDLRSQETATPEGEQGLKVAGESRPASGGNDAELLVELRSESNSQGDHEHIEGNHPARAFEDILARELHENLNGDIVRQASVVLKDGGAGTIRLSLRPESLGTVKIQLEMAENKVTGHIIVESDEALRAFEREVHSLEQAFRDSGFAETSLDTALASGNGNGADQQGNGEEATPFFSERFVASIYAPDAESGAYPETAGSVDSTGWVREDYIPINMLA
ncbi:MAG: flagellar hook-length control protein FliK [Treponema sp.]|jgi:hypothetical protein|nr:flagellar hook-length control protein FliK [Treponema sp.]